MSGLSYLAFDLCFCTSSLVIYNCPAARLWKHLRKVCSRHLLAVFSEFGDADENHQARMCMSVSYNTPSTGIYSSPSIFQKFLPSSHHKFVRCSVFIEAKIINSIVTAKDLSPEDTPP